MKILHLSSSSQGGAGIAATRLSEAQKKAGYASRIISVKEISGTNTKKTSAIKRKGISATQKLLTRNKYGVLTPISFPYLEKKIIDEVNPDVIHIHNWYNLLDYNLIETLGEQFPLVFTMHDERLVTGGCHNSLQCDNRMDGCNKCPATIMLRSKVSKDYQLKKSLFQRIPKFSITAPSQWMIEKALDSELFLEATEIQKIPNIIPASKVLKKKTEIGYSDKIYRILFVAADLHVQLKGFELLRDAFTQLTNSYPNLIYSLTAVGSKVEKTEKISVNSEIIYKKPLDQKALNMLFNDSSLLVVPSLTENAPNIVLEAQSSDLIVLASDVDGIPELIRDAKTGFLTNCNSEAIAKNIKRVQDSSSEELIGIRDRAKNEVALKNSSEKIEQDFMSLYLKTIGISK